jgi:mitofusin
MTAPVSYKSHGPAKPLQAETDLPWKTDHLTNKHLNTVDGTPALHISVMSQEYHPGEGSSRSGSSRFGGEEEERSPFQPPPAYMTVGNGSTSDSATALMSSLNNDSGYGGSIAGESAIEADANAAWRAELRQDRPTPAHTPTRPGEWNPASKLLERIERRKFWPGRSELTLRPIVEHERQVVANHVHQLL